jgi:WD40 repeat protein
MYERGLAVLVPAVQRPEPWVVDRPVEVDRIVRALRRRRGATVGITTAVHGAGGFGKTTVAKLVRADRRALRRFGGRVHWVTLGRDVRKDALARQVNDLIAQVQPDRPVTFTDVRQAGEHLAAVLAAGPPRLLVLDDVWFEEQVAAFPTAGRCARLVTTRVPSLVAGSSVPVKVDQMSVTQARAVLLADLPQRPPSAMVDALVSETGRWPLLLRLVNKVLVDQARLHSDIAAVARELLERIRRAGALQVDQLTGAAGQQLDVNDPDQRQRAVRATIEASTGLLTAADRRRFAELAVFAEDETVPVTLIAALWQLTGGLDWMTATALCARLADLALVTLVPTDEGGAIVMHDVVRELLRQELGNPRMAQLHRMLLQATATSLPTAPAATNGDGGKVTAWWELPRSPRYLWDHLIEHLLATDQAGDAEGVAVDLRWIGARLEHSGPAGPFADLTLIKTPRAERLRRLFAQSAHLLVPTEPPHSLIDILYSRVGHDPDWGAQVTALRRDRTLPALINRWPLPDLPDPALRRTLTGHTGSVTAVAIAPDGAWLASGSEDGAVRIWDPVTGQPRAALTRRTSAVTAMAIAPDGAWLASASDGGPVRIWDTVTRRLRTTLAVYIRATLARRTSPVTAVAIAPDGAWLASGSEDGSVRIWDPVTGQPGATRTGNARRASVLAICPDGARLVGASPDRSVRIWGAVTRRLRATLAGNARGARAVAIAPEGARLVGASRDGSMWIWDAVTRRLRTPLAGYANPVSAVAIAPDGTWLASASYEGPVHIWDAVTRQLRATLTVRPGYIDYASAVAIAPDGTWLASASYDGQVRIWDAVTGQPRATLTGHTTAVTALAIAPDGVRLASGSEDGQVRIWDAVTGRPRATLTGHTDRVTAVAIAWDNAWLASASRDGSVRIWDAEADRADTTPAGNTRYVHAVAFAPDGAWLASASRDRSVWIWDAVTGQPRATLTGHTTVVTALAIAPDGTWLASASYGGQVRIWDAVTGRPRATLTGPTAATVLAIAPDGTWLASASRDGKVCIWDAVTGLRRATLTGQTTVVTALAIAPDGAWLASASYGGQVWIYDAVTGQPRMTLTGHTDRVTALAIAPDGTWLASASPDRSVWIWDAVTGRPRATLTGHTTAVTALAIAPDGAWLASASRDGEVWIWDAVTGQARATLTGHTAVVTALAIAPEGTWLASASQDHTVRVWNPVTVGISAVIRVEGSLEDCGWSPCDQSLFAAGDNGLYHFTLKS